MSERDPYLDLMYAVLRPAWLAELRKNRRAVEGCLDDSMPYDANFDALERAVDIAATTFWRIRDDDRHDDDAIHHACGLMIEALEDVLRPVQRTMRCEECNGDGTVDCDQCDGSGFESCPECDGEGEDECPACFGACEFDCETCDGTGECDGERCPDCDGEGTEPCCSCEGGFQSCGECRGTGVLECGHCGGACNLDCNLCDGTGEEYDLSELESARDAALALTWPKEPPP